MPINVPPPSPSLTLSSAQRTEETNKERRRAFCIYGGDVLLSSNRSWFWPGSPVSIPFYDDWNWEKEGGKRSPAWLNCIGRGARFPDQPSSPSLSLYKFSNINHDFFFSSSPPLSSLLQQRSLPDRLLAGHCSKNYLRPLEKWKKERWKSRSSKISREISCISFLEEGIDSYRFYKFYKRKGGNRETKRICIILTRIALNRG